MSMYPTTMVGLPCTLPPGNDRAVQIPPPLPPLFASTSTAIHPLIPYTHEHTHKYLLIFLPFPLTRHLLARLHLIIHSTSHDIKVTDPLLTDPFLSPYWTNPYHIFFSVECYSLFHSYFHNTIHCCSTSKSHLEALQVLLKAGAMLNVR